MQGLPSLPAWACCALGCSDRRLWLRVIENPGLPRWHCGKESACSSGATGDADLISWVGKIPWGGAWQPTPGFMLGESPWTEEPWWATSTGSQRVEHDKSDLARRRAVETLAQNGLSSTEDLLNILKPVPVWGGWFNLTEIAHSPFESTVVLQSPSHV